MSTAFLNTPRAKKQEVKVYEIYEVPNQELDDTEIFLDAATNLEEANKLYDDFLDTHHSNLWLIECSEGNGYEKVIRT